MKLVKPKLEYLSLTLPRGIWYAVWSTQNDYAKDTKRFTCCNKGYVIRQLRKMGVVCPKKVTNNVQEHWSIF